MLPTPDPTIALRHLLTKSHPDHGAAFDVATAAADRRGDTVIDTGLIRLDHVTAVLEWLEPKAVMILRGPHPLTPTHDRLMILFVRPWEASDFEAWIDTQAVMAKMLGLA